MDNNLQVFNEQEVLGRVLKIYGNADNPLFLAKDVAEWIEHSQPAVMIRTVEDDEKVMNIVHTLGGNQESWFLTEDGLYEVLMQNRKPIAKEFKKEVKRILKQIRKTGGYIPVAQEDDDLSIMIKANRIMQNTINLQNEKIAEYTPKVDMCDTFLLSKGCVSFQHWADSNTQGRNKLMKFLREHKILTKDGVNNIPYVRFVKNGYFKIDLTPCADGFIRPVTKITPKGAEYIFKICKKHNFCA